MDIVELETYKVSVKQMSSEKLCEIVATNRYLNLFKDEAIICMQELSGRRSAGDTFAYETRIDELVASLPKYKVDLNNLVNKIPKIV